MTEAVILALIALCKLIVFSTTLVNFAKTMPKVDHITLNYDKLKVSFKYKADK